jgi:hypothetical protein
MSRGHARPSTPRTKAARVPVTSPCAASVLTPSCPCPTFWRNGPAWRWRRRSVRSRPTTSRQQVVDLGARACGAQVGQIQDCVSQEYNSGHRHWKPAHPPGGGGCAGFARVWISRRQGIKPRTGAVDEPTVTQNRRLVYVAPTHAQAVSRGTSSKQSQVPDLTTYFFFDTYLTT